MMKFTTVILLLCVLCPIIAISLPKCEPHQVPQPKERAKVKDLCEVQVIFPSNKHLPSNHNNAPTISIARGQTANLTHFSKYSDLDYKFLNLFLFSVSDILSEVSIALLINRSHTVEPSCEGDMTLNHFLPHDTSRVTQMSIPLDSFRLQKGDQLHNILISRTMEDANTPGPFIVSRIELSCYPTEVYYGSYGKGVSAFSNTWGDNLENVKALPRKEGGGRALNLQGRKGDEDLKHERKF